MEQLWEWEAVYPDGRKRGFQTKGPDVTEAAMLEHLKHHYRNLTVTALRRCHPRECKPATGPPDRATFHNGIWDEVQRELGLAPASQRQSLIQGMNRDRQAAATTRGRVPVLSRRPSILYGS